MTKQPPHITPAELEIMKVLWNLGSATVQQALNELSERGGDTPAYTTVMTMMKNLAEKKALRVDRSRQPFVYRPAVRREQVLRQRTSHLLHTVYEGRAEDLLLHLAEASELSAEDLRRIEAKIKAREAEESRQKQHPGKKED